MGIHLLKGVPFHCVHDDGECDAAAAVAAVDDVQCAAADAGDVLADVVL